jgi:acyl carrier protein phosphodiesterase
MNYLAHMYLSGDHPEIMIGNFIADHLIGNKFRRYSNGIVKGIRFHRLIDTFTDNHPAFLKSKKRLQATYHKYAGVIVDMFYDHFLAAGWNEFSTEDLIDFTTSRYNILLRNFRLLPPRTKRILPFMMSGNWLASYADLNFLQRSLEGMAIRTPYPSRMENAVSDLRSDYDSYGMDFREFFPEMVTYASTELDKLLSEKLLT